MPNHGVIHTPHTHPTYLPTYLRCGCGCACACDRSPRACAYHSLPQPTQHPPLTSQSRADQSTEQNRAEHSPQPTAHSPQSRSFLPGRYTRRAHARRRRVRAVRACCAVPCRAVRACVRPCVSVSVCCVCVLCLCARVGVSVHRRADGRGGCRCGWMVRMDGA
jgi:hypothetical protein